MAYTYWGYNVSSDRILIPLPLSLCVSSVSTLSPDLLSSLRTLESAAITAAHLKDYTLALTEINKAIELEPSYASAYNNRAQILQLKAAAEAANSASATSGSTTSSSSSSSSVKVDESTLRSALSDVDTAIRLAPLDRSILRQAHTQRGLILKALGDEEGALGAYRQGAAYGNTFAKTESVRLNPYAALCNQYLQQALQNHWSGLGAPAAAAKSNETASSSSCDAATASSAAACTNTSNTCTTSQ